MHTTLSELNEMREERLAHVRRSFWVEVYGKASHLQGLSYASYLHTGEESYKEMYQRYKAIADYSKRRLL